MARKKQSGTKRKDANEIDLLALKPSADVGVITEPQVHSLGNKIICRTDYRAHKLSPFEIVVDATEGFVPLWAENLVLRWKFDEASFAAFQHPEEIRKRTRALLGKAIAAWRDAAPIRFVENADNSDFSIVMEHNDDCTAQGCTLAQAFFPDAGRHPLYIFPKMFTQVEKEQVDTLTHEIGHVFGLRHFFAPESETRWPSEVFGEHKPFSIMNYGANSELTAADRDDLKRLYKGVWTGKLTKINGTPVKQVRPFHYLHT
jgi:Matrixin